uniref:Interferon-related developmental regulator N-terminal domain-containing protein n=1 Tax=Oryza punctata TaxID=4537 RepID=A0A0E0JXD6_ORYPU
MVLGKFIRRSNGHASSSPVLDDEDTSSSACGGMSIYYQKINQRVAVLEKVAVSLHESRASTREAALASLVGALEGFVPAHLIGWHHRGEILRGCCASIKKGAAKEARLALRAAALLAVTLGPGSKRRIMPSETYDPLEPGPGSKKIMAETFPLVSRIVEVSTDASLLIAALESLAVVAFVDVAAENMDDTEACMKALWGLIRPSTGPKVGGEARKTSPHVLAAAVSAWTLVLTTTDGWKKKNKASSSPAAWRDAAAHLASLLHSDSRAVRMAAGEALTVTIEMKLLTRDSNGALISTVAARAAELANEAAGAGVGKANFVEQKELFKNITTFLAGGKAPVSSVRTSSSNHGRLTTSTWTDIVRLNFVRRFLGGGFMPHLEGKGVMGEKAPLIGQVFVVKEDDMAMDEKEKKVEKQRALKKERLITSDRKHGSSDV